MRTILIDADSECFAAAAACERKSYVGLVSRMGGESRFIGPYDTKRALTAEAGEDALDVTPFESREVKDEEAAHTFLDARLRRILKHCQDRYGKVRLELYLTGAVNFRHLVDPTYKWARDRTLRPYWLHSVRQRAVSEWGAKVCPTWEADDEVGIRATELAQAGQEFAVCSLDKDLRQVPGDHLVLGQSDVKGWLKVSERGGRLRLYSQILAGDPVDNIRGCWQVGYDRAFARLEPLADQPPARLWEEVVSYYQASLDRYGQDKCGYINAQGAALHTAQLVYILRNRPAGPIPPRWTP